MGIEPIRCEFSEYTDGYRWAKSAGKGRPDLFDVPTHDPILFYNSMANIVLACSQRGLSFNPACNERATYNECLEERAWYEAGRPYYKVGPGMLSDLIETNIDIDCAHFKMPHPIFEVRFPKDALRERPDAPEIKGILVNLRPKGRFLDLSGRPSFLTDYGNQIDITEDWLIIRLDIGLEDIAGFDIPSPSKVFIQFPLRPGMTIEDCFNHAPPKQPNIIGYYPGNDFFRRILQLTCSVALLASYNSEHLHPDLTRKLFSRYYEAKKRNDQRSLLEIDRQRMKLGIAKGWIIGLELEGQQPIQRPVNEPAEPGHELHFRHHRRCHLRLQPTGPRLQPIYIIKLVRPTIVRPDLPAKPAETSEA